MHGALPAASSEPWRRKSTTLNAAAESVSQILGLSWNWRNRCAQGPVVFAVVALTTVSV